MLSSQVPDVTRADPFVDEDRDTLFAEGAQTTSLAGDEGELIGEACSLAAW